MEERKQTQEKVLRPKSGWGMLLLSAVIVACGILLCVFSSLPGTDALLILMVAAGIVLSLRALCPQLAEQKWNLVLANIVADVIIPLSAQVPGLLAEGGVFLCSGIIDTRSAEVQAAIESRGMKIIRRWEKNGWVALAASL